MRVGKFSVRNAPMPEKMPRGEKAEREAQEEHHRIRDWKLSVDENRDHRADGEQDEVRPASNPIGKIGTYQIADERANDNDGEITAGPEHRQLALGTQKSR